MDKIYDHKLVEEKTYKNWEEKGYFKPEINPNGKPYCIILPPPNANGALHFGHAMFTVEDILIRYHRMKGFSTLWLPGTDHAGIETQFVFEKKLKAEGKSRLDFDRETLYEMIWEYVEENRGGIENQLRRLGFSLDWSREKYTLDPDIVKLVYKTFKKMHEDGLVYRAKRLVNYCTVDKTSFSDLEVVYEERKDPLYYLKYGPLVLATTRPETKFGDTAVAVNTKDKRYEKYVGKEIEIEDVLGKSKIKVIADDAVDPEFGTGVVKVTPAHDFTDSEIGKRHNLPIIQVIDFDGKLNEKAGQFSGMYIKKAREAVVEELRQDNLIEKIDEDYVHRVGVCYKCGSVIEPLPKEQWFLKVESLKKEAINVVREGKIKVIPKTFETRYFQWLESLNDWNISRQIVWGIRIPAWQNKKTGEWVVTEGEAPRGDDFVQDIDTFDTWFSSSQWPFVTLQTTMPGDFEKFYPTSVLETAYDILRAWVSRMVMVGLYRTNKAPFDNILFHGIVNDPYGKKMSKSKGNVVNPLELADQYGADAVRFALIYGNATGNDQVLSYPKLEAAKKFINKIRNVHRFIIEMKPQEIRQSKTSHRDDQKVLEEFNKTLAKVNKGLNTYDFNFALAEIYEFIWHYFADIYIEQVKSRREEAQPVLEKILEGSLKILHPFMPFITEEMYQKLPNHEDSIMISKWPQQLDYVK